MTEPARLARNETRLGECHPVFADRMRKLIAGLEAMSFRPRIQDASRSASAQAAALAGGNSDVSWSFHMATNEHTGTPEALAVDLLDDDHPVLPPMRYLMAIAILAPTCKLRTGILWGLSTGPRERLAEAIALGRFNYVGARGKDPTHVECSDLTLAQALRGLRPAA